MDVEYDYSMFLRVLYRVITRTCIVGDAPFKMLFIFGLYNRDLFVPRFSNDTASKRFASVHGSKKMFKRVNTSCS